MARDAGVPPSGLRVVIADDEPLARDCMRLALETQPDVRIVAECADGAEAVAAIRAHAPDIVFLDVQMPALDGFGVVERIGAAGLPPVVFVTAYDAHAIRAFEVHALDYVLKPFDDARLLAALDRARAVVRERRHGELGRRLAALVRDWSRETTPAGGAGESVGEEHARESEEPGDRPGRRTPYLGRFAVREVGRVRFVAAGDVDWIEADGNYLVLHVGERAHRVRGTLARVAEQLDPRAFARVHRSAVVNVDRIREVQPWFGGDYIAILRTGAKVRVSRQRAAELLRPLG